MPQEARPPENVNAPDFTRLTVEVGPPELSPWHSSGHSAAPPFRRGLPMSQVKSIEPRLLASITRKLASVPVTAPGGGTDVYARLLAQALGDSLKQQFIVENRPGASGHLGAQHRVAIFRGPHKVVLDVIDGVSTFAILWHDYPRPLGFGG